MRIIVVCALLLLAVPAASEDSAVYESIDDLMIGPVFLTPGERRWLDANRHLGPRSVSAESTAPAEAADDGVKPAIPAGFIINSSGQTRQYRNGDFSLSTASPGSMRFPDDVEIRRHVAERQPDDDAEGTDDETADD